MRTHGAATRAARLVLAGLALAVVAAGCDFGGGVAAPAVSQPVQALATAAADVAPVPLATASPTPAAEATPRAPAGPVPAAWSSPPRLIADAPPPPANAAAAAILLDEASAAVLFAQNAEVPLAPASLTKIASAVVAIERGSLDERVQTDVDSRVMRGSTVMGLEPGDEFTLRDLLYGMMLPSGNDAALALGRAVSGSDAAFVDEMNALAERLGLAATRFNNPHGLSSPGHLTSARDMALLARYAMSLPDFRTVVTTTSWTARGSRVIELSNVINDVLYSVAGADGVKSGYTRQAGRTLVASATRDGHRLYAVVLNDQQRLTDVAALLDWGFSSYQWDGASTVARPQEAG